MAIQVIGIGGEPATGKTTLMKELINSLGDGERFTYKLVNGQTFAAPKILVLGIYDGEGIFQGTDRLSMAVQPDALKLFKLLNKKPAWDGWRVYFEGDRLFTGSLIEAVSQEIACSFYLLKASEQAKRKRHEHRGDNQKIEWLNSRKTKCSRLEQNYPIIKLLKNETPDDQQTLLRLLLEQPASV